MPTKSTPLELETQPAQAPSPFQHDLAEAATMPPADGRFRRHWTKYKGSQSISDRLVSLIVPLITTGLVALPLGFLFFGTFQSGAPGAPGSGFTLDNWVDAYLNETYREPLFNSLMLGVVVATASVALGAAMAWIVARTDVPGRRQFPLLLAMPFVFSPLITSLAWIALAAPTAGFINVFGTSILGLRGPIFNIYSFGGVAMVLVLHFAPLAFLGVIASLRNMDSSLEEASRMLGASAMRTALRMTFPLVWPSLLTSFLIIFVLGSENFSVPTLLGSPVGLDTIPAQLYHLLESKGDVSQAAATGTLLLWIALIGTFLQRRVNKRSKRYVTVGGKSGQHTKVRLGKWKPLAFGLCAGYFTLAIVLPLMALVAGSFMSFITSTITPKLFTLNNYKILLEPGVLVPLRNTVVLCAVTAIVLTFFTMVLSYLIQRRLSPRVAAFMDQIALIPAATSGSVLAVGFLWAFLALPLGLYGTWIMIGIAYVTIFLGYGVRLSGAALLQISPDLEEAARVQGASGIRAFTQITFPLLRPAASSLWTLLFVFMFLEVSAVILLYTPTTSTFSVVMWNSLTTGNSPRAFTLAVVQSVVILVVLGVGQKLFGTMKHVTEK